MALNLPWPPIRVRARERARARVDPAIAVGPRAPRPAARASAMSTATLVSAPSRTVPTLTSRPPRPPRARAKVVRATGPPAALLRTRAPATSRARLNPKHRAASSSRATATLESNVPSHTRSRSKPLRQTLPAATVAAMGAAVVVAPSREGRPLRPSRPLPSRWAPDPLCRLHCRLRWRCKAALPLPQSMRSSPLLRPSRLGGVVPSAGSWIPGAGMTL